ncbi:MAG: hypothetical protein JWO79_2643 [Actinomycetia bacterium]|nr:hypothetical protein [Actinomycetes bacterium]
MKGTVTPSPTLSGGAVRNGSPGHTRLGLGVGMDLPWGAPIGFDPKRGRVTDRVEKFLKRRVRDYGYLFFAFQPRGASALAVENYVPAYEHLRDLLPPGLPWAFHHTMLNLGTVQEYDRASVYEFTNSLIERFGFRWVVEDIGIWSMGGLSLPYPQPPYFVREALDVVVDNVSEARRTLTAPLHIEFPGVTDKVTAVVGDMDAYDYFTELAERADAWVTLDVGHLIGWRWLKGKQGAELFTDLDRLPLERCRELHLSGCGIVRGKFLDLHHGVLMDEQLDLCELLLERCPNLLGVTYEDPRYDASGRMVDKSVPNYEKLQRLVGRWAV